MSENTHRHSNQLLATSGDVNNTLGSSCLRDTKTRHGETPGLFPSRSEVLSTSRLCGILGFLDPRAISSHQQDSLVAPTTIPPRLHGTGCSNLHHDACHRLRIKYHSNLSAAGFPSLQTPKTRLPPHSDYAGLIDPPLLG